jgi:hypothetical protein
MMGCLMRTNANPVEVATAKILCEFLPVESEAQGKLALRTAMPTDLGTDIYLFLDGIRDSLGAHLSRRLSERFRTPQVAVNPLPASALPFAPMARYTQPKMRFGVKRTQLTLVARVTQGANLLSGGEGRTELDKGQLGWEIPVAVVFFPIGSIVVLVTLDNREHEAMGRSVAQSLDAAAARLTAQLGEIAATSHSALSVEVGFALAPLSGFAPAPMTAPAPTGR